MVIAGAGRAGARAAIAFREEGYQGPVTLIGDEVLPPYDRPPLSKAAICEDGAQAPVLLLDEGTITSLKVRFLRGAAVQEIDRAAHRVKLADGREVAYEKLLLATGAAARALTLKGAERALTLRDHQDAERLRSVLAPGTSVAIIGGGFIGLELAASASKLGCSVTVIEMQPRILMRGVPAEIAAAVQARHAVAGVTIMTGVGIAEVGERIVQLADGRSVPASVVVAGIGASPRTALAEAAALAIDNGIACDNHLRTSDAGIFAAGDCCSFPHPLFGGARMRLESWRSAADQASVAVRNMLGGYAEYTAVPWFWSDQHDLTLQIAGMPSQSGRQVRRSIAENAFILCSLNDDGRLVGAGGIGPGNSIARDVRLLEMLIGKSAKPDAAALADADFPLKQLLKG
jgi:3-phenylpropionate/trans-cinnamate dioxygenase ferredoxin reductase subunit